MTYAVILVSTFSSEVSDQVGINKDEGLRQSLFLLSVYRQAICRTNYGISTAILYTGINLRCFHITVSQQLKIL